MDDLTPVEPTFSEQPLAPMQTPDHYGTGKHPQPRRSPLSLLAPLVVVLVALNLLSVTVLVRLSRSEASAPQSNSDDGPTQLSPTPSDNASDAREDHRELVTIDENAQSLSVQEVYSKVSPSIAVVTARGSDGTSVGTGVVLSEDGYLLTNAHTVENALQLEVTLYDGSDCTASFVGSDSAADLAVLKLDAAELTPAEFGSTDELTVGDEVIVITNALGVELAGTMTKGTVAALNDDVPLGETTVRVLQIDAAGLSAEGGGVVVNAGGQIVGIGIAQLNGYTSFDNAAGVGFALSAQETQSLINALAAYGIVDGGVSLGIEVSELTRPLRVYWHLPEGVLISKISRDGAAYRAGLRLGDVLLSVGEESVASLSDYVEALGRCDLNDTIRVTIYRNGTYYFADITPQTAD